MLVSPSVGDAVARQQHSKMAGNLIKRLLAKTPCYTATEEGETTRLIVNEHLGQHANAFGQQSISTVGSFVLNINNIIGPAVVTLPALLQVCS